MSEVWILGGTGRVGRATAKALAARRVSTVLVGRDASRLNTVADTIDGARVVALDTLEDIAAAIAREKPAVVINTVGPFVKTALPIARACLPASHYLDLSNELTAIRDILGMHQAALIAGRCLVAGAGYGVLGTESIVLRLCEGRPPARRVRVDAIPFIGEGGIVGAALASSILESVAAGGRRYEDGRLVRANLVSDVERFTLPDGSETVTGGAATGDLEAAHRASGADFVVAGSSEAPSSLAARILVPMVARLLRIRALRELAIRRLAALELPAPKKKRDASWSRARVEWSDGTVRTAWLRAPEGMEFTVAVTTEVAQRLLTDQSRPGAFTPGALFGADLAVHAGGTFVDEPAPPS